MTVEASPLDRYWATAAEHLQALLIQVSRGTALFLVEPQDVLVLFRGQTAVSVALPLPAPQ
jgi:hypothetical protein